jgi:hypothetical protein
VARYLAKALAAVWCQGYCDVLNRAGRWDEAIPIVAESERFLREALEEFEEDVGDGARECRRGATEGAAAAGDQAGGRLALVR